MILLFHCPPGVRAGDKTARWRERQPPIYCPFDDIYMSGGLNSSWNPFVPVEIRSPRTALLPSPDCPLAAIQNLVLRCPSLNPIGNRPFIAAGPLGVASVCTPSKWHNVKFQPDFLSSGWSLTRARGGIGRRARLRIWSRKGWRFKSSRAHHLSWIEKAAAPGAKAG